MIAEYKEVRSPDGLRRKYSVHRFGDHYAQNHILFSRDEWEIKSSGEMDDAMLAEERDYVEACPHLDQVREVFELARIDYGRMDYSVVDGRIQIWEINTNPMLLFPPSYYRSNMRPLRAVVAKKMNEAFRSLDQSAVTHGQGFRLDPAATLDGLWGERA